MGINAGVALFPNAPFGGYKSSGVGKELGRYALDDYTNTKTIYIRCGTLVELPNCSSVCVLTHISTHSTAEFWAEKKG